MPPPSEAQALIESLAGRPAAVVECLAYTAELLPPSRIARVRRLLAGPLPRWAQAPADVRHVAAIIQRLKAPEARKDSLLHQAASADERFRPYLTRRATLPGEARASRQRAPRTRGEKAAAQWKELPPRLRLRVVDELLESLEAATATSRVVRTGSSRRARRGRMTRADFIDLVAEKAWMSRAAAARAVDAIFDTAGGAVSEAVHVSGELSIPGFGKFSKKTRAARQGRSPRTGKEIEIPEQTTISFTAGRNLREGSPSGRRKSAGAAAGPAPPGPSTSPGPSASAGSGRARPSATTGGTGGQRGGGGGARGGSGTRSAGGGGSRSASASGGARSGGGGSRARSASAGSGGGGGGSRSAGGGGGGRGRGRSSAGRTAGGLHADGSMDDPGGGIALSADATTEGARGGPGGGGPGDPGGTGAATEARRFTDVTVYRGELYPSDDLAAAEAVPDDVPLAGGEPYTLGVAIRLKRTGIGAAQETPRGVQNPREDRETVTVYVRAVSELPGVEIEDSLATLEWPYDADSGTALFRLEVKPVAAGTVSRGFIDVRLYDASLDLLDLVHVHDTVVPRGAGRTGLPDGPARRLSWPAPEGGTIEIAAASPARLGTVHVKERGDGFHLDFIFRDPGDNKITIGVLRDIGAEDLTRLLRKVRNFWTELVIANYARNLTVTRTTFAKHLTRLVALGKEAWITLFGNRRADQTGASERVGQLLATTAAEEGSPIQITYEEGFQSFVFPWSILYPADRKGAADPLLFWGARYQIEQVTRAPRGDALADEPINVVFALDRSFGNAGAQEALWKEYQAAANGKLHVTDPISDEGTLFDEMARTPPAHLLYFYCHGYASSGAEGFRPDGVQQLKRQIEALGEESEAREALETLFSLIPKMGDESWIYIGDAEITESTINQHEFFDEGRRPVVFLNMCQSAELLPSMSSGLVRVFLDRNASAIIGTESPMTAVFANAFAEVVFDALFGGDDVGTALWKARRHFLQGEMRNPLGLAYTLYGRATARLGRGPVIARTEAPEHAPPTR
ncbi:MAG TPA: HU family DNA-binding protein [Longimicrobium sp.]|nr:HU family DNA-binding protein [Longimicrobium sp.]